MKKFPFGLLTVFLVLAMTAAAWAVEVKPEGRIFAGFSYNVSGYPDWDSRYGDNDYNEFEIGRAYLGFKVNFNDYWSGRITGDVTRTKNYKLGEDEEGNTTLESSEGLYGYYLKYAYGDFTPYKYFNVRFGLLQTAYIELYDNAFGYRYVVKSPADLWKFDTSADNGLAAYGAFGPYAAYYVVLRNGEGYKSPEENKGKGIQASLKLTPFQMVGALKDLQLVGAAMMNNDNPSDPDEDVTVINVLLAYKYMFNENWGINIGGGYDMRQWSSDDEALKDADADQITSTVVHGYGVLYMPYNFGLFARYDMYDPDTENDEDTHGYQDEQSMLLAGVSYDPLKNLAFSLNYKTIMYTAEVTDDEGEEVTKSSDSFVGVNAMVKF
ncbi:MAG TPA: hypothetical protein PKW95_17605 [bacterium]|nr:hypothetical protein [bacterium]